MPDFVQFEFSNSAMSIQAAIFLLLMGALQGVLFVLLLIQKKLYRNGYVFLLLYLGVFLLQLIFKLMNKIWLMDNLSAFYSVTHYLLLLSGPLAFLFTKELVLQKGFKPASLIHFLPFISVAILVSITPYGTIPLFIIRPLLNPDIRLTILLLSICFYHISALAILRHAYLSIEKPADRNVLLKPWLRNFLQLSLIVCCITAFALYLLYTHYPKGYEYRYGFLGLSFFMYWISYSALKQPSLFLVLKGYDIPAERSPALLTIHRQVKKYSSSNLPESEKKRIREELESIMKKEKLYLDPELTIDMLTEKISCSRHALSQVLNESIQQTFYNYINTHRIEEAKRILSSEQIKVYKISSVAYDSGFNSLSTFNDVFKKMTGLTPSGFRDEVHSSGQKQRI